MSDSGHIATLSRLRDVADDYCKGEDIQRVLLESVCERFLVLADEKLAQSAKVTGSGETPRTDAEIEEHWKVDTAGATHTHDCVPMAFARQLERELAVMSEMYAKEAHAKMVLRETQSATVSPDSARLEWLVQHPEYRVTGANERGWSVWDCSNGLVSLSRALPTVRDALDEAMRHALQPEGKP